MESWELFRRNNQTTAQQPSVQFSAVQMPDYGQSTLGQTASDFFNTVGTTIKNKKEKARQKKEGTSGSGSTGSGTSATKEDMTTVGQPGGVGGPTQNQGVEFQEKMRQIVEAVLGKTFI